MNRFLENPLAAFWGLLFLVFVAALIAAVIVLLERRRFKAVIFRYLDDFCSDKIKEIEPDSYLLLESVGTDNSIFGLQISITFQVGSGRLEYLASLKEIEDSPIKERKTFEVTLAPGDEIGGDQVFFYTFLSNNGAERSIRNFERFIVEHYKSPEQLKLANESWWMKLKSKELPD